MTSKQLYMHEVYVCEDCGMKFQRLGEGVPRMCLRCHGALKLQQPEEPKQEPPK